MAKYFSAIAKQDDAETLAAVEAYGEGGQTFGETMGSGILARIGAAVNPDKMHAERVDGYNPLAVADGVERMRLGLPYAVP